jgi:hypothetical protein
MKEPGNSVVSTPILEERERKEREARVLAIQNRGDGENSGRRSKRELREVSHKQI